MKNVFRVFIGLLMISSFTGYGATTDLNQEQTTFIDADFDVGDMIVNVVTETPEVQSFDFVEVNRDIDFYPEFSNKTDLIVILQKERDWLNTEKVKEPSIEKQFRFARDGLTEKNSLGLSYYHTAFVNRCPRDGIRQS